VTALAALGGATATVGVLLVAVGVVGTTHPATQRAMPRAWSNRRVSGRRLTALIGVPLVVLVVTGWPVTAILAFAATAGLPALLGSRRASQRRIRRLQGLADWTRRLSDVLRAGAGIEQAIDASLPGAPASIADDVGRLVARLRARRPVEEALLALGDDLDDPTGDLVVAALLLAADRRGRGLARLLTALAATVDAEVAMRERVEADRATPRTTARWVAYIAVAVTAGLVLLDREYVAPFGTPTGQVVLALVGTLFAGAFTWMHRLTTGIGGRRFLPADATRAELRPDRHQPAPTGGGWPS
jgi:tight adherence protein B